MDHLTMIGRQCRGEVVELSFCVIILEQNQVAVVLQGIWIVHIDGYINDQRHLKKLGFECTDLDYSTSRAMVS